MTSKEYHLLALGLITNSDFCDLRVEVATDFEHRNGVVVWVDDPDKLVIASDGGRAGVR